MFGILKSHFVQPRGYAEKEGDARQFHPKLRPPVNPEELEIDERTGMKARSPLLVAWNCVDAFDPS